MDETHVIYWLKRDFRLADNPALTAALEDNENVTPVYLLEPALLAAPETSAFHLHAIQGGLHELNGQLRDVDRQVFISVGEAISTLNALYERQSFSRIYAHEEIGTNWSYQRDEAVRKWCKNRNVAWIELPQTGVFRGKLDRDKRQKRWKAFTFSPLLPKPGTSALRRLTVPEPWKKLLLPVSDFEKHVPEHLRVSEEKRSSLQAVGETAAQSTLRSFLYERGIAYRGGISSPVTAMVAGSRLSVHLAWGTLTGRTVYQATRSRKAELAESNDPDAGKWRSSLTSFLSRLHWRDHFIQRLETEPQMEFHALNEAYDALRYDNNPAFLAAWEEGVTGFPMADACIRCMRATGFINFRMRAMLTSLACHALHLDWRLVNAPMARLYTDYEPGIHLSQLQMQASVVGINTIRMYSPTKQIIDQDPETAFIKEWIPELRDFSPRRIADHRDEPLGDYPGQLVDRSSQNQEMRNRLWAIRKLESTKEIAARVYAKHGSRKGPASRRKRKAKPVKEGVSPNKSKV